MAIEFFTGFEGCNVTNDALAFLTEYSGTDLYNIVLELHETGGFGGSKCIRSWSVNNGIYSKRIWFAKNTVAAKTKVVGWHINGYGQAGYDNNPRYCVLRFVAGSAHIGIFNTSAGLKVYRGSIEIASSATVLPNTALHLEVKLFSDSADGGIQIKHNGILVLDEPTGLNTGGDNVSKIIWGCTDTDLRYWDNLFIADDWQGELKSFLLQPTADDVAEFVPSSGSDNYAMVQDNDGDANYVESDVVDAKDLYEFADLVDPYEIAGISVVAVARKDDVGARLLQPLLEHSGVEYDLASFILGESYPSGFGTAQYQVLSVMPNSDPFDMANVNAMKLGYKVV